VRKLQQYNWTILNILLKYNSTISCLNKAQFVQHTPDLWPLKSPDLDPVDYCVWSILQEKLYRTRFANYRWTEVQTSGMGETGSRNHCIIDQAVSSPSQGLWNRWWRTLWASLLGML